MPNWGTCGGGGRRGEKRQGERGWGAGPDPAERLSVTHGSGKNLKSRVAPEPRVSYGGQLDRAPLGTSRLS